MNRLIVLGCLAWLLITSSFRSPQTCASSTSKLNTAKQDLERDKNAIRSLGFDADADAFNLLASASAEQRELMVKTAYENLIGSALDAVGESAKAAQTPFGDLPNGFASLNPINVNAYVARLDNPHGPVASLLKEIAATSDKRAKLKLLEQLTDAAGKEQDAYDILFGDASTAPQSLADYLGLAETLATLGGFDQVSKTLESGTSGADTIVAYANLAYGKLALKQLNELDLSKAQALATLNATMKLHVEQLQSAKQQFAECQKSTIGRASTNCKADESAINNAPTTGAFLAAVAAWRQQMDACEAQQKQAK